MAILATEVADQQGVLIRRRLAGSPAQAATADDFLIRVRPAETDTSLMIPTRVERPQNPGNPNSREQ
eukprot:5308399-Amphidinium_carterae.2